MISLRELTEKHLGLAISGFLALLAALKILFVSGMDINTALLVLSVTDRVTILVSLVFMLVAIIAGLSVIDVRLRRWIFAGNKPGASTPRIYMTNFMVIPLLATISIIVSIPVLIGVILGHLTGWLVRRKYRRKAGNGTAQAVPFPAFDYHWIVSFVAAVLFLTLLSSPWMPRERVGLESGDFVVGLIVGEQANQTLMLEQHSVARWVTTGEIVSREVCRREATLWSPLISHIRADEGVPCE